MASDILKAAQARLKTKFGPTVAGLTPGMKAEGLDLEPQDLTQAEGPEAKAPGVSNKAAIWAGLMGAAAAIQANMGRGIPGQEFKQGLLRGVVGTGVASAAGARLDAAKAASDRGLSDKIAVLEAKDELEGDEPTFFEKEAQKQKNALERIKASGDLRKSFDQAKLDRAGDMTEAQVVEMNNKAWDNAQQKFKAIYQVPSDDELSLEFIVQKNILLSGRKKPKAPKLPD